MSYDEIMAVQKVGQYDTYDFVIPDGHCFFANGVLVHNSSNLEEDSDSIILLYRPEMAIKDLQERMNSEHHGVMEVHVAKHRQLGIDETVNLIWQPTHHRYGAMETIHTDMPAALPSFGSED